VTLRVSTVGTDLTEDDVIPEVAEMVGSAYVIGEGMREDTMTFTY
jgi:hypothetical protein